MIIICNGMIRSGSTLQYNLVKDIIISKSISFESLGFVTKEDVANNYEQYEAYATVQNIIYLLKTHDYTDLNKLSSVYIIYSYRNLYDVAASLKRKFGRTKERLIFGLKKGVSEYKQITSNSENLLIQEYDQLLKNLEISIKEIGEFLKLELDGESIQFILEKNSVNNIIKIQNKNKNIKTFKTNLFNKGLSLNTGIKNGIKLILRENFINMLKSKLHPHSKDSFLHLNHVSENLGKNGVWKEILDDEEIKLIDENFKDWTF